MNNQKFNYWTKDAFVAVEKEHKQAVLMAEACLPEGYCIIKTSMLCEIDDLEGLITRVKFAEEGYHKLEKELLALKEKFNVRD